MQLFPTKIGSSHFNPRDHMLDSLHTLEEKELEYAMPLYPYMTIPSMIKILQHQFKTLSEATALASHLSNYTPNHSMTTMGLSEIFLNAIEHGNLGIEFRTKSMFASEKQWFEEINKRLLDTANIHKYVSVTTELTPHYIKFTVTDQGQGFDFEKYHDIKNVSLTDTNGRGILIAKEAVFDKVIYSAPGNTVECIIFK